MSGEPLLEVSREQVLGYRRRVQALDQRLPAGPASLRKAAWAGLQDSVPRAALHSLHARVEGVGPEAWEDPALVQVWGPRFTAYVVPANAHAAFTLARMPEKGSLPGRAADYIIRADQHLAGRRLRVDEVASALGIGNGIRYATLTGRVLIRWNGARQPTIWTVPHPTESPAEALQQLARRYLRVYGPSTVDSFVRWGGLDDRPAMAAFDAIASDLIAVRTPLGEAWLLAEDEHALREPVTPPFAVRLLPSGDPYYLWWGANRELLVADPGHRAELWTSRVWPGALLVGGEIAGIWRRSKAVVVVTPWRRLSRAERDAVEAEAATLPLPDIGASVSVQWEDGAS
jgi:hypothetical protein